MRTIHTMQSIVLIAHNLRSTHNVGSLLRTAEGLGITHVYLTGYTPYPTQANDTRLPHESIKITEKIHKTALGAENLQPNTHFADLHVAITKLKNDGYSIIGLEQSDTAIKLPDYQPPKKVALLLGSEVDGIAQQNRLLCDALLEIPMFGSKESFNVVHAAAMALYHCRFMAKP